MTRAMTHGRQHAVSAQDAVIPSHAAPLFPAPPIQYRNSWLVNIPFQTDRKVVEDLVPRPLEPNRDGYMLLTFNRLNAIGIGLYNEAVLSIPCTTGRLRHGDSTGVSSTWTREYISGRYAGYHPADSEEAIAHLEALRQQGAAYLLFPSTAFWWLEYYRAFKEHLERHYQVVCRQQHVCLIFALERRFSNNGHTRTGRP